MTIGQRTVPAWQHHLPAGAIRVPGYLRSRAQAVLHSFGRDFKPWNEYGRTIRTELERQSPWPLDITDHSLLNAR
jgi:hypothetical protein